MRPVLLVVGLPLLAVGTVAALGLLQGAVWIVARAAVRGLRDRRRARLEPSPTSELVALPQREPGAAKAAVGIAREERYAHLDAVWAQCSDSEPYVAAMLASHEAEVTHLLELALELDDQAPRGGDQRGHVAE